MKACCSDRQCSRTVIGCRRRQRFRRSVCVLKRRLCALTCVIHSCKLASGALPTLLLRPHPGCSLPVAESRFAEQPVFGVKRACTSRSRDARRWTGRGSARSAHTPTRAARGRLQPIAGCEDNHQEAVLTPSLTCSERAPSRKSCSGQRRKHAVIKRHRHTNTGRANHRKPA